MVSTVAAAELLEWRRKQLKAGGEASQLDWLLDLEGGIGWQTLQQLRLHPERSVRLAAPLSQLEQLWQAPLPARFFGNRHYGVLCFGAGRREWSRGAASRTHSGDGRGAYHQSLGEVGDRPT